MLYITTDYYCYHYNLGLGFTTSADTIPKLQYQYQHNVFSINYRKSYTFWQICFLVESYIRRLA